MEKCNRCQVGACEINPKTQKSFYACEACRLARRVADATLTDKGICRDCRGPSDGKTRCLTCVRKIKRNLRAKGKCGSCGGCKDTSSSLCKRCILKNIAKKSLGDSSRHEELLQLLHNQNYQCPITGLHIELGINASVDHIIPRNRGGNHSVENLRWVHVVFNRMKSDFLDSEFVAWLTLLWDNKNKIYVGPPCLLNAPLGRTHSWPSGTKISSV